MTSIKAALCGMAFALSLPASAFAADCSAVSKAEVTRLSADIREALKKNQYGRADGSYEAIEDLGATCASAVAALTHYNGGLAARGLGNMGGAKERFLRAPGLAEAKVELAAIAEAYGEASITKTPKAMRTLVFVGELPFDPGQRNAIEFAKKDIVDDGNFIGLLPLGTYKLGTSVFGVVTSHTAVVKRGKLKK
jgi:hypothetical protein